MKKSYIYWFVILWLTGLVLFWSNKAIPQNSNVSVNITLTPQQYSNILAFAANRNLTVEQFLSATNLDIVKDIRQRATQNRVNNALDKFRTLTDAQKDQVLNLIESF